MAEKRMGMLGVRARKMKALTVKMKTVTIIGKVRHNMTCFVYYVYEINNNFLTEVSFLEFILDLDKYIFPLADIFFLGGEGGGHIRLQLSCIQVYTVPVMS
jgi:hypothetical protein